MIRSNRQEGTAGRLWRRLIVLPLCICLLSACGTARKQVLSVRTSETERLRDLLSRKRIDASFADGTHVAGRVQEVQDGLLVVDVKESVGPTPSGTGLQSVPMDRISTVQFTQRKGSKRTLLGILGTFLGLSIGYVGAASESLSRPDGFWIGTTAVGGFIGYMWGREEDKENVTVVIQQPDVSGGP